MAGFGVAITFQFHYLHLSRATGRNWSGLTFRYRSIVKPSYSGHCTSTNVMHNAARPMYRTEKYKLPEFLIGIVSPEDFRKWLSRKASSHTNRDRKREIDCKTSDYKQKIYNAVLESQWFDFYTKERMDWKNISKFAGKKGERGIYKRIPTVDHAFNLGAPKFKICSWRTNDCKSDLTIKELKQFCKLILENTNI